VQLFLLLVNEIVMFLTWYAFLDEGLTAYLNGWPKVVDSKYLGSHGPCTRMVAAYSFMYFSKYVLCMLFCNTFKQGLSIYTLSMYKLSPIIVYRAAFASHPLSVLGGRFPVLRYWIYGVVQLSAWPNLRQMFVVDGVDSVCCRRDLCLPLSLVLASLDKTSAHTFSHIGVCWMCTLSKPDCMMLHTR